MHHFIALSLALSVAALIVPRDQPSTWTANLEPYSTYHTRYLALDCNQKHNTSFFKSCCHPLSTNQPLSSLPSECDPSNDTGDDDCGDDDTSPATTEQGTPTGTPTPVATHTPTPSAPVATHTPNQPPASSASGYIFTGGVGTFFYQDNTAGACGKVHGDYDYIGALDSALYGNGAYCGKQVTIINTQNQQTVIVTIADECPTCKNANSIDLSVGAFKAIADPETGVVPIRWSFT